MAYQSYARANVTYNYSTFGPRALNSSTISNNVRNEKTAYSMNENNPISTPSSISLSNSRLYCVGGKNPLNIFRISIFDSNNDRWTPVFENHRIRHSFGIASIGDKIYIAGGSEGLREKKGIDVFDCKTATLSKVTKIPFALEGCSMTSLHHSLFISGGQCKEDDDGHHGIANVYHYNTEHEELHKLRSMNYKRAGHQLIFNKERLYSIGGNANAPAVEEYQPVGDIWITPPVKLAPQKCMSATVHENVIYVCGERSFQMLVPGTSPAETLLPSPPNIRANSIISFNGKLFAIGGCLENKVQATDIVSEFDPRNRRWIHSSNLNLAVKKHGSVVVDF